MIVCVCANPAIDAFVHIDDLAPGESHRALREERFPGGKGVHVALACAELGASVVLAGFWGGPTGAWVRERCERLGVRCIGPQVDGWTRTCVTFKSPGPWDDTELLGVGPEVDARAVETLLAEIDHAAAEASCLTISGSLPRGCAPGLYADLIRRRRAAGTPAYLDCTGEALTLAIDQGPHAVHLNRSESATLCGRDDPRSGAVELARRCAVAVVTAGAAGAYVATGDSVVHAACPVDAVHSAVGSGDCLLAGLATAHDRGHDGRQAVRLAVACGAANCLRPELGMLHRADVERLLAQVTLTDL